jgi:hypothetical protein
VEVVVARLNPSHDEHPVVICLAHSLIVEVHQATRPTRAHGHLRRCRLARLLARQESVKTGWNQEQDETDEKATHYAQHTSPASLVT